MTLKEATEKRDSALKALDSACNDAAASPGYMDTAYAVRAAQRYLTYQLIVDRMIASGVQQ